jgi:hypothetical protein
MEVVGGKHGATPKMMRALSILARHRLAATSDNLALMREAVEHLSSVLEIADEAFRKYETEFDADDTARLRAARDFEQATLAKLRDEIARGEG